MALLDTLKQNLAAPQAGLSPEQRPGAVTGQTQLIQQLAQAQSGKAGTGAGAPRISSLGEQIAARQAELGLDQLVQQGQLQAQGLQQEQAAAEQKQELQLRDLDERRIAYEEENLRQTQAILDDYVKGVRQLDLNKDKAKVEKVAFDLRLANDKYIKSLQNTGRRARLDNEVKFNEELTRAIFAEEEELFRDDLTFRGILAADDREFRDYMSDLDLDFALKMAEADAKEANQRLIYQGLGTLVQAGAQAYGNQQPGQVEVTKTQTLETSNPQPFGQQTELGYA